MRPLKKYPNDTSSSKTKSKGLSIENYNNGWESDDLPDLNIDYSNQSEKNKTNDEKIAGNASNFTSLTLNMHQNEING